MSRQHRLLDLINVENIISSSKRKLTVINAKVDLPYREFCSADLTLIQPLANFYDEFIGSNEKLLCEMEHSSDVTILHLPKSKIEGFGMLSKAIELTQEYIIIDGNKKDGIDSYFNGIKKLTDILGVSIKDHGKAFCFDPKRINKTPVNDWKNSAKIKENIDGFFTAEGMFSPRSIDKGSHELASAFTGKLNGCIADLGAGWGWLSHEALKQNIKKIDLYEAHFPSFQCSKLNIQDVRADFFWIDVLKLSNEATYDMVIMNPPFHLGRATDLSLGEGFLVKASEILKKNGTLHMVANRHLPYEKTLSRLFKNVTISEEKLGFKIIEAKIPK